MILNSPWALQMLLGAAGTAVAYVTHSVDDSGTALTYSNDRGVSAGTTPVSIVGAPGSGNRVVTYVEIVNQDSVQHTVTVRQFDGSNARLVKSYVLPPGAAIFYIRGEGFSVMESNGAKRDPGLAGVSGSILFNGAGIVDGATSALIEGEELTLPAIATPTAPSANRVKIFGRDIAGRILPAIIGPSGFDVPLQPHQGKNRIGVWAPPGNATTIPLADGIAAPTGTGTATARNVATTNIVTQMKRLGYVSAATAGSLSGFRLAVAQFFRGGGAGLGGFHLIIRFVPSDAATVASPRSFVGMSASTAAPTNVEPNTLVNIIGVGANAANANLRVMHNDGAGVATEIDLGASFPANTLSANAYELSLFCPSNASSVGYRVANLVTGAVAVGTISTDLPASTTLLGFQAWRSNNATALAVGIDLVSFYIETDF